MPTQSVWTQAASNYITALNAAGSPATIWRTRFEAVDQSETALNLYATKIEVKYGGANDSASIESRFTVRGYVAATDEVDLAADPLVVWAWQQLRIDPSLGQTVSDARIDGIEIGYADKSASDQVCVDISICVEVEVGRDDPTINKTYLG
jgi:hypothetical protein